MHAGCITSKEACEATMSVWCIGGEDDALPALITAIENSKRIFRNVKVWQQK